LRSSRGESKSVVYILVFLGVGESLVDCIPSFGHELDPNVIMVLHLKLQIFLVSTSTHTSPQASPLLPQIPICWLSLGIDNILSIYSENGQ